MPTGPIPRLQPVRKLDELREMFRRGASLEDFRKYYHQYKGGIESHAEFRRVDEAIQFLEDNGGYTYPEPKPGAWITESRAWVAIEGNLPLYKYPKEWFTGELKYKFIVNVVGLYTRVLVLDSVTARIWEHLSSNPRSYDKAFHWTLIIRPLVSDSANETDITRAVKAQVAAGVDPAHMVSNGRFGIVAENTDAPSLRSILAGEWIPSPRRLFWFDGSYHLLLLPTWLLTLDSFHEVNEWTYFF